MQSVLCKAAATFRRARTRTLGLFQKRTGSLVFFYVDDIINRNEIIEDHWLKPQDLTTSELCGLTASQRNAISWSFMPKTLNNFRRERHGATQRRWTVLQKKILAGFFSFAQNCWDLIGDYAQKSVSMLPLMLKLIKIHWSPQANQAPELIKKNTSITLALQLLTDKSTLENGISQL